MASEIVFLVEESPEGGYTARALSADIFTDADDMDGIRTAVREAVECHFDDDAERCKAVRLHRVNA